MNPKISVVIPVYNQEKYLAETINSVITQTFTDFELILVDDGSKDKSVQIIQEYAKRDDRIVPLIQANSGKPKAINAAVAIARGEYVAFMDHDDLMLPNRLEKQLAFHEKHPEIDGSSSHCYYIDDNGKLMGTQIYPGLETVAQCQNAVLNNEVVVCAFTGLTVKKAAFVNSGGLKSAFWPNDDTEFFNRFIEKGYSLIIIQDFLMQYRAHSASTTIANAWEMYIGNEYTNYYITSRRQGKPELSYEEFIKIEKQKPLLAKIDRKRLCYAIIFQKEAGFAMHRNRYTEFIWKSLAASVLNPKLMLAIVRKRISA
ncbi:MAG: glycosyltransferase family 2 protein [Hymenobacter sp.]|nr:MAG: glycosyltransferase family 2 protein [Hymenobacter sp.]